jgi:CBS domain-containing protein
MSSPLITIEADALVGEAMELMMEKKIRRLYIVENKRVVARVTQTKILESMLGLVQSISSLTSQA